MRVLVTGNLGYVGTVMTPLLHQAGYEVWGLDTGFYQDCVLGSLGSSGVTRQLARDLRSVTLEDLHGIEAIVHLGALSNDPTGELNPKLMEHINLKASVELARLAKQAGVSRFVFASSCSVYGQSDGVLTEASSMNPLTAYARSKVETEHAARGAGGRSLLAGVPVQRDRLRLLAPAQGRPGGQQPHRLGSHHRPGQAHERRAHLAAVGSRRGHGPRDAGGELFWTD